MVDATRFNFGAMEGARALVQCLNCWHRWEPASKDDVKPCPECGDMRRIKPPSRVLKRRRNA